MSKPLVWHSISQSPEETEGLGVAFGVSLHGGEVIELVSDLGGGKTTFVRGLARGIGSTERVTSPTFMLAHAYAAGGLTLHHFDFYRLHEAGISADELAEILADTHAIVVVEWGDIVRHVLPDRSISITIRPLSETRREFSVTCPEEMGYVLPKGQTA